MRAGRRIAPIALVAATVSITSASVSTGVASGATPRTAPQWSVASMPAPVAVRAAEFNAITCVGSSNCIAVGSTAGSAVKETFAERWDGGHWKQLATPTLADGIESELDGVSCATATLCFAVGDTEEDDYSAIQPLLEQWNGAQRSVVDIPTPAGFSSAQLSAVSCGTSTSCTAVGSYGVVGDEGRLVERWDGAAWAFQSSPSPSPAHTSAFEGVSCVGASDCNAVGWTDYTTEAGSYLVEHWNGTAWSITAIGKLNSTYDLELSSVSCSDTWHCLAVGSEVTVRGEGGSWTDVTPSPAPWIGDQHSVKCIGPVDCLVVGGNEAPAVERWDGSNWTSEAMQASEQRSSFAGIACPADGACRAAGTAGVAIRSANGWRAQTVAPSIGPAEAQGLSVACTSASHCFAVGLSYGSDAQRPFGEWWNGTRWTVDPGVSAAVAGAEWADLEAVTCANASSCTAVGAISDGSYGGLAGLVLHWNGSRWTRTAVPPPGHNIALHFSGVACPAASLCYAVGGSYNSVIYRWSGGSWSREVAFTTGDLESVSCADSTDCVAVGGGTSGPFIVRLHGGTWQVDQSAAPSNSAATLESVSCATPTVCVATGYTGDLGSEQTLAERFDGTQWWADDVTLPGSTRTSELTGVSCARTTDCWAVGDRRDQTQGLQPQLQHWDGTQWTAVTVAAPPGFAGARLDAVSCSSSTACVTVGSSVVDAYNLEGPPLALVYR